MIDISRVKINTTYDVPSLELNIWDGVTIKSNTAK